MNSRNHVLALLLVDGDVSVGMSRLPIETWDAANCNRLMMWFLFVSPFWPKYHIKLHYTFLLSSFFHILLIQRIFIFMFIILCDIISYSIWFSLLNHLNSSGNGHGQLFLSFFYFSSFLLIFLAFPPLFPVLCTYIHLIELSLGWHPWQLSQAPCFVPQPVIPTPFRKTNSYIGLWAQTRLRLKSHSHIARQTRFQPPFPFTFFLPATHSPT